jgi:hypothetical protein
MEFKIDIAGWRSALQHCTFTKNIHFKKLILKYCLKRVLLSELWDQFKQMETTKAVMMLGIECFATYVLINLSNSTEDVAYVTTVNVTVL